MASAMHAIWLSAILVLAYGTRKWWVPAATGGRLVFSGSFGARNVFALTSGAAVLLQLLRLSGNLLGSMFSGAESVFNILLTVGFPGCPIWLFARLRKKYKAPRRARV